jgi:CheY-like chemotaxis protein
MLDVAQILNLKASGKGIQLSIESEPDVPSMVRTDSLRLRQILLNIIGNAIKFTHQGGVSVHLKLIQQDITKLAFIVKDTGIGIAADQTHELFQAFSQADVSTKRKYGGTGLGLILSKRLANLLGGDIVLTESRLGEGSTFTITIDPGLGSSVQKTSVELLDSTILKLAENDQMSLRLVGVSVLLVEDSQDIMQLVGRILLEAGAKVDYANNGKEALARAHNSKFDVILMDLQMPVMDGYEATAQLRKEGYKAPIIAVSAHALKEEHESCLAAGFASHISKPIDGNKLLELIAKPTSRD